MNGIVGHANKQLGMDLYCHVPKKKGKALETYVSISSRPARLFQAVYLSPITSA
jgi:hypothetical protein